MKKKELKFLGIFWVVLVVVSVFNGCISEKGNDETDQKKETPTESPRSTGSPEDKEKAIELALENSEVNQFREKYPEGRIDANYLPEEEVVALLKEEREREIIAIETPKPLWLVIVSSGGNVPEQPKIFAYVDIENEEVFIEKRDF